MVDLEFNRREVNDTEFNRQKEYRFFSKFDKGYYSLTTEVAIDGIIKYIDKYKDSFYCIMTFVLLKACNNIENFCYRKENDKIYLYHNLAASCTVLRQSKNLEFTNHIYNMDNIQEFSDQFHKKRLEALNEKDYSDLAGKYDLIYITAMPWFRLKAMNNVRANLEDDTIPRFSWGQYFEKNQKTYVDLSIEISHMFIDGYHVHLLLEQIERIVEELNCL